MNRRNFIKGASVLAGGLLLPAVPAYAKSYLSVEQARQLLWGDMAMTPVEVMLTDDQVKAIRKACKVRVRNTALHAWRTANNGWFILDQVIGKHENIDLAVALNPDGTVRGVEVLTYRETYGHEIRNRKWRAQFYGWGPGASREKAPKILKLDRDIKNISGATLSCRHVTDGVNRLAHTWDLVLRQLAK